MKKTTKKRSPLHKISVPKHRLKPTFNGIKGLAASYSAIGIPTVIETEISVGSGASAHLFREGNIPVRSGYGIKIKL